MKEFFCVKLPTLMVVALLGLSVYWAATGTGPDWSFDLTGTSSDFQPHDWTSKGPVPLPDLGEVDVAGSSFYDMQSEQQSPVPDRFDSESALDRPSWKIIVANQMSGCARCSADLEKRLFKWMENFKKAVAGSGVPTEVWFLRLNRPYFERVWTEPMMFEYCGKDGGECFNHYLIFAESALDYSLERQYLNQVSPACSVLPSSPTKVVMVVDPEGNLRHTYSHCTNAVTLQSLLLNFEHHAGAQVDHAYIDSEQPYLPGYALEPSARDSLAIKGAALITQATETVKEKTKEFDEAVKRWAQ